MASGGPDILDVFGDRLRALQLQVGTARARSRARARDDVEGDGRAATAAVARARGRRRTAEEDEVTEGLESALDELRVVHEELIATRAQVEAERSRYRDLFEFAPDGYLVTTARGRIGESNRAAVRMLKVPDGFLIGKPLVDYVAKDDRPSFLDALRHMRDADRGVWTFRMTPRKGDAIVAQVTAGAVRQRGGTPASLRWIIRDVTEPTRVEREVAGSREKLRWLATELARAEERERRRIAAAIHDRVSQTLAIAKMKVSSLRESVPPSQRQEADEAVELLAQAVQ